MGDSAEFEKLSDIEARLATALDRIADGLAIGAGRGGGSDDPAILAEADAARLEAESRATELMERVAALEERLAETQTELTTAQAIEPRDDAELKRLRATLAEAQAAATAKDAALEEMQATKDAFDQEKAVLDRRVSRLRSDRDAAQDALDEMREGGAADPDARVLELRAALRAMQQQVETLTAEMAKQDSGEATADAALRSELDALRALRASEAAELTRIIGDISSETGAEVSHA